MVALTWSSNRPPYESGVDRGVLYPNSGPGVAWNGLVSVEDSHVGGDIETFDLDGVRYLNTRSNRSYKATISAYAYPPQFGPCIGERSIVPGFILTRQPKETFGFSYRTLINGGEDYHIHVVYNATATPTERLYETMTNDSSPQPLSWDIEAVPEKNETHKPTAHYIIRTSEIFPETLVNLEKLLYGFEDGDPYLPSVDVLHDYVSYWNPRIIMEPPLAPGIHMLSYGWDVADLTPTRRDGVYRAIPGTRLRPTETSGIYTLE